MKSFTHSTRNLLLKPTPLKSMYSSVPQHRYNPFQPYKSNTIINSKPHDPKPDLFSMPEKMTVINTKKKKDL